MDRLPVELLRSIADFVETDPGMFDAQRTLAILARVNKTFHTICHPRLYLEPALGNAKMVQKWIRKYSSLVNPWSICAGTQHLELVVVLEAITFEVYKAQIEELEDEEIGYPERHPKPVDQFLPPLNDFALSTFLFRNVTCISVSSDFPLPEHFLADLCGPFGTNRNILAELSFEEEEGGSLKPFLFEAHNRMVWELCDLDYSSYMCLITQLRHCEPLCESIHRLQEAADEEEEEEEDGRCYISDAEFDKLDEIAPKYGSSNYRVSSLLYPASHSARNNLPSILKTRNVPCHPFKALRSLTVAVSCTFELYYIFHSRLFPVLDHLKLTGWFEDSETVAYDVKLLRHSVTKCQGEIESPRVEAAVTAAHPTLFDSWDPLTKDEMENPPKNDHFGPNLEELDLSECGILSRE
ncbi:uncharacterized protein JCM6883_003982 [Sporobolomyces salmoneus]|uniref:uncharacterized protein n=1 Tax=Sporobolomyces salmoneus TaxID=183962 RepID=UPI003178905A